MDKYPNEVMPHNSNRQMRMWCLVGMLLSGYSLYVKIQAEQNGAYSSICDLGPTTSCTAAFTSVYGSGFGLTQHIFGESSILNVPNGIIGIVFYTALYASTFTDTLSGLKCVSLFCANVLSVYLLFLLIFVLKDLCLICVSIYIVNLFAFIEAWSLHHIVWCPCGRPHIIKWNPPQKYNKKGMTDVRCDYFAEKPKK